MKFSPTTHCLYPDDVVYQNPPSDLFDVPEDDYIKAISRKPGETLAAINGRLVVVPVPIPTVDQQKADAWESIKAERDRRKSGGVKVGAKWFHSDDASRIQQIGLIMMGASLAANLQWKTMDGSFITMTQALASQVFQAVAASDQAVFTAAETHRATMEASADPASYDYSTGWPKIYGE